MELALEQLGGLDWVLERISDGDTMIEVSETLTRHAMTPITRSMVDRWVNAQPEGATRIAGAREASALALVERASVMVHRELGDKDDVPVARLRMEEMHKRAGWFDRQFSQHRGGAEVTINIGTVHLDALRTRSRERTALAQQGSITLAIPQVVDAEEVTILDDDG